MKNLIAKKLNKEERKAAIQKREFYNGRSLLGYDWAIFLFTLGGREAGKSYFFTEFFVKQFIQKGRPFYWMRLTDRSQRKLLMNNAEKLVDADLRRKYNLDIVTSGENVYQVTRRSKPDKNGKTKILEKKLMARVMCLSTFYNDKGSALFDKDFLKDPNMYYNICLDEMQREKNEKNTFDIVYAFVNQIENIIRSTKTRVRIVCIGNTLEEASDLLCSFNFIPEKFGRFKIRKKRAVIENIEPTEAYKARRKGTVADILMPNASNFTNKIETDNALIVKKRLIKPQYLIKFSKDPDENFVVWDGDVITKAHNQKPKQVIAMRPYIDEIFNIKVRNTIFEQFDSRGFKFRDLITFKQFQKQLELLRPNR